MSADGWPRMVSSIVQAVAECSFAGTVLGGRRDVKSDSHAGFSVTGE